MRDLRVGPLPQENQKIREGILFLDRGKFVLGENCRVDKRSASTMPAQKGGCAALIHPTFFAENKFTLIREAMH